ncbi:hypothetical protein [Weissella minor]|uniref:Uncharacterized protein n=1 Tax=Weissella minor TaxID=1620 RepID=A0A0R2JJQ0_9LACO|nr:hypothetical protein [Weissella minor]KRN77474.1 hypothetical protein IV67_GL001528 [Weissella minor]
MSDLKRYVIIDDDNGVFEGKAYYNEDDAKVRAFDALKSGEIKNHFSCVDVQEISF